MTTKELEKFMKKPGFKKAMRISKIIENKVKKKYPRASRKQIKFAMLKASEYDLEDINDAVNITIKILKGEL